MCVAVTAASDDVYIGHRGVRDDIGGKGRDHEQFVLQEQRPLLPRVYDMD